MVGHSNRELRNSIDTLRLETDKQAGYHSQLAQQMRTDLEGQVGAFVSKQQHHKKVYQAAIEKEFKVKQTREQHASRAREKYESDCLRINSYTAQSTLVQGKDLEKINLKLERAQQTVQVNENDYAQFTRVLQETMQKWEQDWKAFCDTCQDLEEERTEFMKDNMWAYANAVSTVCVSDDEVRDVRRSVVRDGSFLASSVVREDASRIGTIGAGEGYGKLCSGLWNRELDP